MIVIEKILEKAFDLLPNLGATETTPLGFKPYYDWGNEDHLRRTYIVKKNSIYPLIYQTTNTDTQRSKENSARLDTLTLVLAVPNLNISELNKTRWMGSTFSDILFPLAENIETLLTKGMVFGWDGEYRMSRYPNYGKDTPSNEPKNIDTWDALVLEIRDLTIYGNVCLQKEINF